MFVLVKFDACKPLRDKIHKKSHCTIHKMVAQARVTRHYSTWKKAKETHSASHWQRVGPLVARTWRSCRSLRRWGISRRCRRRPPGLCTRISRRRISPCRCRARRPQRRRCACCCCSCSTPLPSQRDTSTRHSHTPRGLHAQTHTRIHTNARTNTHALLQTGICMQVHVQVCRCRCTCERAGTQMHIQHPNTSMHRIHTNQGEDSHRMVNGNFFTKHTVSH